MMDPNPGETPLDPARRGHSLPDRPSPASAGKCKAPNSVGLGRPRQLTTPAKARHGTLEALLTESLTPVDAHELEAGE